MRTKTLLTLGTCLSVALLTPSCQKERFNPEKEVLPNAEDAAALAGKVVPSAPTVTVFATGLNNPRGLKFGPDGALYVAEGGKGGQNSSAGQCAQVIPPVGPYKGSPTGGRISKINSKGTRTTVVDNLPSSVNAMGEISGVGDIAFVGNTLYALVTGGGCSHGVPTVPNGIYKINHNGTHTLLANLSNWSLNHPVKNPEEDDYEPDGDWYSMIYLKGDFYAIEANHGEIVRVSSNGKTSRLIDISATQGHIVPTVLTFDENFYVGNLHPFPIVDGSSSIYRVTQTGKISIAAKGFTTILGIVIDRKDRLYVLENTVGHPFPTLASGQIIRIDKKGNRETIATGLSLPTGMTMGPDGNLYVSNVGFGPASIGGGQVLKVSLPRKYHDDDENDEHCRR